MSKNILLMHMIPEGLGTSDIGTRTVPGADFGNPIALVGVVDGYAPPTLAVDAGANLGPLIRGSGLIQADRLTSRETSLDEKPYVEQAYEALMASNYASAEVLSRNALDQEIRPAQLTLAGAIVNLTDARKGLPVEAPLTYWVAPVLTETDIHSAGQRSQIEEAVRTVLRAHVLQARTLRLAGRQEDAVQHVKQAHEIMESGLNITATTYTDQLWIAGLGYEAADGVPQDSNVDLSIIKTIAGHRSWRELRRLRADFIEEGFIHTLGVVDATTKRRYESLARNLCSLGFDVPGYEPDPIAVDDRIEIGATQIKDHPIHEADMDTLFDTVEALRIQIGERLLSTHQITPVNRIKAVDAVLRTVERTLGNKPCAITTPTTTEWRETHLYVEPQQRQLKDGSWVEVPPLTVFKDREGVWRAILPLRNSIDFGETDSPQTLEIPRIAYWRQRLALWHARRRADT